MRKRKTNKKELRERVFSQRVVSYFDFLALNVFKRPIVIVLSFSFYEKKKQFKFPWYFLVVPVARALSCAYASGVTEKQNKTKKNLEHTKKKLSETPPFWQTIHRLPRHGK